MPIQELRQSGVFVLIDTNITNQGFIRIFVELSPIRVLLKWLVRGFHNLSPLGEIGLHSYVVNTTDMKFILGKKLEMSHVFNENGRATPVTLVKAGPIAVIQIKSKEKDGYEAIQVGFGEKKLKNIAKPQKGHTKNMGIRWLREFRIKNRHPAASNQELGTGYQVGDIINVSLFKEGDTVTVSGISKGKGFQGVVKRHGFKGGSRTHGQKHSEREPGSIGATWPQRVLKGMRMAGRMGNDRITIKNLKIVKVDIKNNVLAIQGAVPGARGSLLEVRG